MCEVTDSAVNNGNRENNGKSECNEVEYVLVGEDESGSAEKLELPTSVSLLSIFFFISETIQ